MKHELLAPAGSLKICKAVIAAGADAVYLGGSKYGARAFAQNFTEEEVLEALDYAHLYGRKIFMTVNTLLKNREMGKELYDYLKVYYQHGLDAIIVQDYGVFQFVRKYFPALPVHVSTQMSVSNVDGARLLQQAGAERIVTARELSLQEIRAIYDETGVEIESFVHGALCYCYSGQCLMSSILGGRSGNRGRCAQPCRLAYQVIDQNKKILHKQEKYPISPKDLCVLDMIPQLCEAGIYSFKIEGRMKSLEYAAGVTQMYRKYLDLYESSPADYKVDPADMEYLMALGNRNGFTKGYYEQRNGRSMMTLTESSHSSIQAKTAFRGNTLSKIPVSGHAVIRVGEPMQLWLDDVYVFGQEVSEAQKRPAELADVRDRLMKTGETPFEFSSLDIELGENCFVPVKQLNELRRQGFDLLLQQKLGAFYRELPELAEVNPGVTEEIKKHPQTKAASHLQSAPELNVTVSKLQQLDTVLGYPFVTMVSLDISAENHLFMKNGRVDEGAFVRVLEDARKRIVDSGKMAGFCFPYIFRQNSSKLYENEELKRVLKGFDCLWVRSYDSLGFARDDLGMSGERIRLDHNLYVYSQDARNAFEHLGIEAYTASLELNQKELRHMPNENAQFMVYGYVPMMISAQCVYKNYAQCYKNRPDETELSLNDRYLKKFFIKRDCKDCYNIIYNSQPLYLLHQAETVQKLRFGSYRIAFVTEKSGQIRRILDDFDRAFLRGETVAAPNEKDGYTNGHFKRGID